VSSFPNVGGSRWVLLTFSPVFWYGYVTSTRGSFGYTANADTVLIAWKERNTCTNERVADGRKNSIPGLDSPFEVMSNGW